MKIFLLALLALGSILLHFDIYLAIIILILFFVLCIKNKNDLGAKETSLFIIVFLAFFIQGHYSIKNHTSKLENKEDVEIILSITDPLVINGDYLKTRAQLEEEDVEVAYNLNNKKEKEFFQKEFYAGQIKVIADIEDIQDKKNFYSFDYKDYQNKHSIYKQVKIKEIKAIRKDVDGIFNKLNFFRAKLIKNIDNNLLFNQSGYFQALIFGDKSSLSSEDKESFSKLGISHLLAISGLNIVALLSIIYFVCNKLNIDRKISEKILIIILPLYTVLAGFSPSVIRASAMALAFILLKKLKLSGVESLLIVFISMIFINPYYIFDIGFQFSFFTSFSLLMSSAYINSSKSYLKKSFKVTLIASFASLPIALYYFYTYSYISIISNLIFVPYFTLVIFPSVLITYFIFLLSPELFSFLVKPYLNFIFYINDLLIDVSLYFSHTLKIGQVSRFYIYSLVILVLLIFLNLNNRKYKFSSFLILLMIICLQFTSFFSSKAGTIEEMNLNGRNVYYIRDKDYNILINTSNNNPNYYDDFRKKIKEYDIMNQYQSLLDYEGIKEFDYLILSKTSSKDIGQAENLISKGKVKNVLILDEIKDDKNIKAILEVAKLKNIKFEIIKRGSHNLGQMKLSYKDSELVVSLSNISYKVNGEK